MITPKKIFLLFLSIAFLLSCREESKTSAPLQAHHKLIIIDLQPFDDIPEKQVTFVYEELLKIHPNIVIYPPIKLPAAAYYKTRKRYRADTLINYLRQRTAEGHVTIGLTGKDISSTKEKIEDYGIMGLGYQPGRSCVVSTFRLSKDNLHSQLFKLSIHELGHTQGLAHCRVKTCFMRDAEGKNHTDEENDFCFKCKKYLLKRGWIFS